MKKILLINGHEYWDSSKGELNKSLVTEAESILKSWGFLCQKTIVDAAYEVEEEVEKFLSADVVLYFAPVYWFGIPSGFKAYIEKVFSGGKTKLFVDDGRTSGGQYGSGGLMQKKKYMLITTWNAPADAFNNGLSLLLENKSVDDIFLNFHTAQKFIGFQKMPSISFHDVKKKPDFERFKKELLTHFEFNVKL